MTTTQVPIPINGYSDSLNHQHGAEGFSTSMMNVVPIDVWQNRRRVGTRQGYAAIADMGTSDDYNIQEMINYEVYRATEMVSEVLIVAGGSVFYADKNGDTHDVAYSTAGATATVTFNGSPTVDQTIIITDTVGTSKTYAAKTTQTEASNEFTIGADEATASVTFTGIPSADKVITLISTDGTTETFTSKAEENLAEQEFNQGSIQSIATIEVTAYGDLVNAETFIILDHGGDDHTFVMSSSVTATINNIVGFNGVASNAAAGARFAATINDSSSTCADNITAYDNEDGTVTLRHNLGGATQTNNDTDTAGFSVGNFINGTVTETKTSVAQSLKRCIEHQSSAVSGKITVSGAAEALTLTQALGGAAGNTAIVNTLDNATVYNFGDTATGHTAGTDGDANLAATSLTACINHSSGHGSTITAVAASEVITLTQDTVGTATSTGNTDITNTLSNVISTNFSGAAYAAGTNRIHKSDKVRGVIYGTNAYLATGRQYYKIDFSESIPVIEEWTNYNGAGGMPSDNGGNKCTLITRFGARVVMSGLSSSRNNWFMSKIGDAEDWTPTAANSSDAQAGDSSTNFGVLGEPITALFPFGESGLMMAGRGSLTFLTADPVVSGAQMIRMSNGIGVVGENAWCQGPEKTCYIASSDGVYLIQPNQFNIQRGQSTTTARLDGFFASLTPNELDIHLAYDPPRSMIFMFANRTDDPSNVVHYVHHIPTQSWWTLQIADPRIDVVTATCLNSPLAGEREGLWIGCRSGRISCQPTTGVIPFDGGAHTSPLRSLQDNEPVGEFERVFTSRLAWSPINAGLPNERLLMTEIGVLLDAHTLPTAVGGGDATMVKSGPTLSLYGAGTAQELSGISGDVGVTETRQIIEGGAAGSSFSTYLNGGDAVGRATCTVTVVAYNLLDSGADSFTLKDTTGTSKTFTAHSSNQDDNEFTIGANNNATAANIVTMLAVGSNSAWTGVAADNVVTITQQTAGSKGNQPVTDTAADTELTTTNFTGGQTSAAGIGYPLYPEVIIELSEGTISDLDGKDVDFNDLGGNTVDIKFESSLAVNASTTTQAGCSDADENLLSIMKGLKKSIDLNYASGLLNLKTYDPYPHASGSPVYMKIRTTDAWNGYSPMPTVTDSGSGAVTANYIQTGGADPVFGHDELANWAEFVDGGRASRHGGTLASPTSETEYGLDDSASSETLRKWSLGSMYSIRKSGNRSLGTDPSQFEGVWGIFDKATNKPVYMGTEPTATISLADLTSTEVLPTGFTASTAIMEPSQDESGKELLQSWTLVNGRNNRLRVRKRESDFQLEISASGTAWVLEDLAINIEKGGPYRSVITA